MVWPTPAETFQRLTVENGRPPSMAEWADAMAAVNAVAEVWETDLLELAHRIGNPMALDVVRQLVDQGARSLNRVAELKAMSDDQLRNLAADVAARTTVDEAEAVVSAGRNERCRCGSGHKYKHCCGG